MATERRPDVITTRARPVPAPAYRGHHSVHLYLALLSLAASIALTGITIWAYYDEGQISDTIAYYSTLATLGIVFCTFFWGCFLVMNGTIPRHRLAHVIVHASAGCLTPLFYALMLSAEMQTVGHEPLSDATLSLCFLALAAVVIQLLSGWSVLRRTPWVILNRWSAGLRRSDIRQ